MKFLEANDKKENTTYRDKVFFTLIEELSSNSTQDKFYANLIKNYIRKYILVYDKENAFSPRDTITMKPNLNKNDYDNFLNNLKEKISETFTLENQIHNFIDYNKQQINNPFPNLLKNINDFVIII